MVSSLKVTSTLHVEGTCTATFAPGDTNMMCRIICPVKDVPEVGYAHYESEEEDEDDDDDEDDEEEDDEHEDSDELEEEDSEEAESDEEESDDSVGDDKSDEEEEVDRDHDQEKSDENDDGRLKTFQILNQAGRLVEAKLPKGVSKNELASNSIGIVLGKWSCELLVIWLVSRQNGEERGMSLVVRGIPADGGQPVAFARIRRVRVEFFEDSKHPSKRYEIIDKNEKSAFLSLYGENTFVIEFPAHRWIHSHDKFNRGLFEIKIKYKLGNNLDGMLIDDSPPLIVGEPRLVEILSSEDYFLLLTSYLDVRSIRNLQSTCKQLRHLLSDYVSSAVRKQLGYTFHDKLPELQKCLRETGAIISGSTALRCLFRSSSWKPNDVDILVKPDNAVEVTKFLKGCGYKVAGSDDFELDVEFLEDAPRKYSSLVWTFVKGNSEKKKSKSKTQAKIDVCVLKESRWGGAISGLLKYHSTVVMNFISASGLVVLFPDYTLAGKNLRNEDITSTPKLESALAKYANRGFRVEKTTGKRGKVVSKSIQSLVAKRPRDFGFDDCEDDFVDARSSDIEYMDWPDTNGYAPSTVWPPRIRSYEYSGLDPSGKRPLKLEMIYSFAWGTKFSWEPPKQGEWAP